MSYLLKLEPTASQVLLFDARVNLSMAVSLKRIADALTECDKYGQRGSAAIATAISDGLREGRP